MFKTRDVIFFFVLIGTLASAGYFANDAYKEEVSYREKKSEFTEMLSYEDRLLNVNTWLFPSTEWEPKRHVSKDMIVSAEGHHSNAITSTWIVFAITLAGLLIIPFIYRGTGELAGKMTLAILFVAMLLLAVGVTAPLLEIEAYSDDMTVPIELGQLRENISEEVANGLSMFGIGKSQIKEFLNDKLAYVLYDGEKVIPGRMYFYYQNKSAVGVMSTLSKQNNYFVLGALMLFSFIIPFLKLTVSIIMIYSHRVGNNIKVRKLIGYIGKLSMGDVFVASMYLAYMSFYNMNAGMETDSGALIGLYFFTGYVVLSIISYFFLERHIALRTYEHE